MRNKFYILHTINYIQMTKKKNIVITGVLGQDGQILSNILIKKNFNIIGVVKNIPKTKKNNIKFKK